MTQDNGRTVMVDGRIVWVSGDLFKGRLATEFGSQKPKLNKKGEQFNEFGFGLAVPKAACGDIWTAMHEEAYKLYPSRQIPPSFAMKFKDGDTAIDEKGVPYSQRIGYQGHIVLSCTTTIQPKFFRNENGQNIQIVDGIKCGDYVRVQLTVKSHPAIGAGKAGLYMNPNAVLFLGYGEAIINAPTGDQIFGTQAPAIPPGASATPIGPAVQMLVPTAQPAATMPQATPHYGVLPQQHQPAPQPLGQHYPPQQPPVTQAAAPAMPAPTGFPPIPQG